MSAVTVAEASEKLYNNTRYLLALNSAETSKPLDLEVVLNQRIVS
jgi:hypothetical protein